VSTKFSTVTSMSSRVMSGSSALSTSSCSPVWNTSTGGTHVAPALKPKSRNGSQRTIVISNLLKTSQLLSYRTAQLRHADSAYSASTTSPSLTPALEPAGPLEPL